MVEDYKQVLQLTSELHELLINRQIEIFELTGLKIELRSIGELAIKRGLKCFSANDIKQAWESMI